MSKDKTQDDYEVGYGKPPKNTQFQKAVSGNPRGRSKKPLDFDQELIRESESLMTIKENGRPIRISKHKVVVKQVTNQAANGSPRAIRIYFDLRQQALERAALVACPHPNNSRKYDLTAEELTRIAAGGLEKTGQESG
jgi:hypothetical protein